MCGRFGRPFFRVGCFSSRKTSSTLERMERVRMIQCIGVMQDILHITYCIYKNVRVRSINVVVAMLWKNAYNMTCWKMFQHNNKYVNIIWLKPLTVRCGGSCIGLIFNSESAQGMDQIRRYTPIFRKFFGFRGTAWGV